MVSFFFFCIFFLQYVFLSIEKFVILCVKYFIPYYCIYRNEISQNLNSLLRLLVANVTFAVCSTPSTKNDKKFSTIGVGVKNRINVIDWLICPEVPDEEVQQLVGTVKIPDAVQNPQFSIFDFNPRSIPVPESAKVRIRIGLIIWKLIWNGFEVLIVGF